MDAQPLNDGRENEKEITSGRRNPSGPVDTEAILLARSHSLSPLGDETTTNSAGENEIPSFQRATPSDNLAPALTPEERAVVECLKLLARVGREARLAREGVGEGDRKGE